MCLPLMLHYFQIDPSTIKDECRIAVRSVFIFFHSLCFYGQMRIVVLIFGTSANNTIISFSCRAEDAMETKQKRREKSQKRKKKIIRK